MHTFQDIKTMQMKYMTEGEHYRLQNDLIKHLWTQNEDKDKEYLD